MRELCICKDKISYNLEIIRDIWRRNTLIRLPHLFLYCLGYIVKTNFPLMSNLMFPRILKELMYLDDSRFNNDTSGFLRFAVQTIKFCFLIRYKMRKFGMQGVNFIWFTTNQQIKYIYTKIYDTAE